MNVPTTSGFELTPAEKLQLVEDLWDDLSSPRELPVRDWQRNEIERHKANLLANPAAGLSWSEVQQTIRERRFGR